MKDEEKTKAQLIEELKVLRGSFSELEFRYKAAIDIQGRYKDFIENMDDVCFELDLDGKIIFGNNALPRLSGYTPEEYRQLKLEERYAAPEEAQRIIKIYIDMYRKGKRGVRFFSRHRSKEGKILTLETSALLVRDAEGNPIGFRGISRDVTERIRVEEDLKKYKEFIENIEDSCYERDFDGHYLLYNDALLRKSGFTIEELTQESWETRIVSQEERERVRQVYEEVYRTGIPAKLTINKLLKKDGGIQSVELLISLSRDATGTPKGYRIISWLITERVKMEQEQERYRNFAENISDGIWESDLAGNLTFINEAMSRIYGYTREELIGLNNRDYTAPEEAKRIVKIFNEIYKTGSPREMLNIEVIRKNGEIRDLEISASLIRDPAGNPTGFRGVSRDITERRKMEAENERYRDFVENIDDGCYELDLNGTYTFVNEAACRRFGYTREEFMSLDHRDMSTPEGANAMLKVFNEIYRTGIPAKLVDSEVLRKDKKVVYTQTTASLIRDSKGNPVGFRGVSRDVTERKKMEEEQERYRNFIESISEICFENDLKGTVTFMNEALCRVLDLGREEIQHMNFRQFVAEDTWNKIFEKYNEIYRTGKTAQFYNFEIIRKDGIGKFLDITVGLFHDAEGHPIGFRGVARDVTERKRMEEAQEVLKEQINQIRKLESIGTLAGGIAHDFNNLLMGIQGYTSLMLLDIDSQHPHYEPLKAIESQVWSGAELTKHLLGYARRGRYEVKSTDLNELLTKTVSMFSRTNNEIQTYQKYEKLLWKTEVDPRQIEQVFLDLFLNAAQAMPGGGSLYLETENTILDEQYIKPYEITPGAYVKISVTDTGMGMDEETMLRIFEPKI